MKQPNLIIMPVLNCLTLTRRAVVSCLKQDIEGGVKVHAIDASSTDGVWQWLRILHPRVQVSTLPRTAGVSKAWNGALSHAFDFLGAPYALVVNNDIRLREDAYKRLVSDGGGFVTCVGTSTPGVDWSESEPSGEKRPHPDFSCFLIRKEVWEKVGKFDESMVIYCSDCDYHLRMHRAGIEAYCLDLPFEHYASGTLKQADEEEQARICFQAHLDRKAFMDKCGVEAGTPEYYKMFGKAEVVDVI